MSLQLIRRFLSKIHFMNNFFITFQIQRKIHIVVIQLLLFRSQQIYAHAMTAQLSWHPQNLAAITVSNLGWEQNEIYIKSALWGKNCDMDPSRWNRLSSNYCDSNRKIGYQDASYSNGCQDKIPNYMCTGDKVISEVHVRFKRSIISYKHTLRPLSISHKMHHYKIAVSLKVTRLVG